MDRLDVLKALGQETRLDIVEFLEKGEKCVCEIVPHTGKSQPNVSLQLKKLEEAGILSSRKDGTKVMYSIQDQRILKILNLLH